MKIPTLAIAYGISNGMGFVCAAAFSVDGNLTSAAVALVSTVVATLTVAKWIDARIDHKLRNHANIETYEHRAILVQVSLLRELIGQSALDVDEMLKTKRGEG